MELSWRGALTLALLAAVIASVATYVLALPLGFLLFFFTPGGKALSESPIRLPVELFVVMNFHFPVTLSLGVVFTIILAIYLTCFMVAWKTRESFLQVVRNILKRPLSQAFNNSLFATPVMASMLLLVVVLVQSFQEAQGLPTGSLKFSDQFKALFALSYSPLSEELSFRLTPIGAFAIVYVLWKSNPRMASRGARQWLKLSVIAFLFPDKAKEIAGLKSVKDAGAHGISRLEWLIIVGTSAVFGLAHYASGAGWGPGKVTSAFVAGLVLGITYLVYGAQVPILIHWFFNYYFTVYNMASEAFAGSFKQIPLIVESLGVSLGIVAWLAALALGLTKALRALGEKTAKSRSPAKCTHCGAELLLSAALYCPKCGARQPLPS